MSRTNIKELSFLGFSVCFLLVKSAKFLLQKPLSQILGSKCVTAISISVHSEHCGYVQPVRFLCCSYSVLPYPNSQKVAQSCEEF